MKNFLRKNYKKVYVVAVIFSLIAAGVYFFLPVKSSVVSSFGTCLREQGLKMYGSDTCEACKQQKRVLRDEFDKIDYVNCQFNLNECNSKNIAKYPTWVFKDQYILGVQSREALSELSGCEL